MLPLTHTYNVWQRGYYTRMAWFKHNIVSCFITIFDYSFHPTRRRKRFGFSWPLWRMSMEHKPWTQIKNDFKQRQGHAGCKLIYFPCVSLRHQFLTQEDISSAASQGKKAVRATLRDILRTGGGGCFPWLSSGNIDSVVCLFVFISLCILHACETPF